MTIEPSYRWVVVGNPGEQRHLTGYVRSDGIAYPYIEGNDVLLWEGTTSTDWQRFDVMVRCDERGVIVLRFFAMTRGPGFVEYDVVKCETNNERERQR